MVIGVLVQPDVVLGACAKTRLLSGHIRQAVLLGSWGTRYRTSNNRVCLPRQLPRRCAYQTYDTNIPERETTTGTLQENHFPTKQALYTVNGVLNMANRPCAGCSNSDNHRL